MFVFMRWFKGSACVLNKGRLAIVISLVRLCESIYEGPRGNFTSFQCQTVRLMSFVKVEYVAS